jgi:hypothetical protein
MEDWLNNACPTNRNILIEGNTLDAGGGNSQLGGTGCWCLSPVAGVRTGYRIVNNHFTTKSGYMGTGLQLSGHENSIIAGNTFECEIVPYIYAIGVYNVNKNVLVQGNTIRGQTTGSNPQVYITGSHSNLVIDSLMFQSGGAVVFENAKNVVLQNSSILAVPTDAGAQNGITLLGGTTNIAILGTYIAGYPVSGIGLYNKWQNVAIENCVITSGGSLHTSGIDIRNAGDTNVFRLVGNRYRNSSGLPGASSTPLVDISNLLTNLDVSGSAGLSKSNNNGIGYIYGIPSMVWQDGTGFASTSATVVVTYTNTSGSVIITNIGGYTRFIMPTNGFGGGGGGVDLTANQTWTGSNSFTKPISAPSSSSNYVSIFVDADCYYGPLYSNSVVNGQVLWTNGVYEMKWSGSLWSLNQGANTNYTSTNASIFVAADWANDGVNCEDPFNSIVPLPVLDGTSDLKLSGGEIVYGNGTTGDVVVSRIKVLSGNAVTNGGISIRQAQVTSAVANGSTIRVPPIMQIDMTPIGVGYFDANSVPYPYLNDTTYFALWGSETPRANYWYGLQWKRAATNSAVALTWSGTGVSGAANVVVETRWVSTTNELLRYSFRLMGLGDSMNDTQLVAQFSANLTSNVLYTHQWTNTFLQARQDGVPVLIKLAADWFTLADSGTNYFGKTYYVGGRLWTY